MNTHTLTYKEFHDYCGTYRNVMHSESAAIVTMVSVILATPVFDSVIVLHKRKFAQLCRDLTIDGSELTFIVIDHVTIQRAKYL